MQNTDTGTAGDDCHGLKLGYLLTDHVTGYVDYESRNESFDSFTPTADTNPARQGAGFGAGIEWTMTDKVDLRFDYVHTVWQSQTLTDVESPDDDTGRVALVYRFK